MRDKPFEIARQAGRDEPPAAATPIHHLPSSKGCQISNKSVWQVLLCVCGDLVGRGHETTRSVTCLFGMRLERTIWLSHAHPAFLACMLCPVGLASSWSMVVVPYQVVQRCGDQMGIGDD
jgi:hypothetical protein